LLLPVWLPSSSLMTAIFQAWCAGEVLDDAGVRGPAWRDGVVAEQ
jgi:hypothetical protein